MNIKNFLGINHLISPMNQVGKVERQIKSESSQERDANGQQLYEKKKNKEKMSQEQFDKALALLREKSFIKEMNWNVLACDENGIKYAWIQDQAGQSIRKIYEYDLWEIFDESQQIPSKGQLLKKSA